VGFGLRASTPVGPIEADLGFGLNREGGDGLVQFAFSIGPDF
jgi:outer membrane translocation and assembly module TamA